MIFLLIMPIIAEIPNGIDFTLLFSILAFVIPVCIAGLVGAVKIAAIKGATVEDKDKPSNRNDYCQQREKEFNRIEKRVEISESDTSDIKTTIGELKITITEIQKDVQSSTKTITEMKQDNRDLARKLEGLLSQLINYVGD